MTQPTSGDRPKDPYEQYRAEALERDRIAREERDKEEEESQDEEEKITVGAKLLFLFEKFVSLFETITEKGLTVNGEKIVRQNLQNFRESLEIFKKEDRSQDAPFINIVSEQWHILLEDALKFRKSTPLAIQFVELIKAIESYPQKKEHTFGYYLMEYAGQKWLPFPFVELLQQMHREHQNEPASSALTEWVEKINALILKIED